MKLILSLICAIAIAFTPSCTSPGGTGSFDPGPAVSVLVTYKAAKITEKSPARAAKLNEVADALDILADGVVNKETVTSLLLKHFSADGAEEKALIALLSGYFPSGDAAIPVSSKLSALARSIASAIRAGLPASK